MQRVKTIGVILLALFAFSAVAATAAQAEEAPYWSIEGTRLAAGKTFEITAKQYKANNQVLESNGLVVTCPAVEVLKGSVLLGSNAGEPGKSNEILKYSGCTQEGNGTGCTVTNGEVVTNALTNELAYAKNKKSLVVEFTPGVKHVLAVIKLTGGTSCTKGTEDQVTGQAVAEVLTDPGEVLLELPNVVAQAESFLLRLPNVTSTTFWLIKGGVGTEVTSEELTAFGHPATLAGTALILLAEKGVSVKKLWSPLL